MPAIDAVVTCPVHRSFRVEQLAGMFDVALEKKVSETFSVELPDLAEDWRIGVIVGPSGSGKTTIAREAFGRRLYDGGRWPKEKAVVDGFGDRSIKEITRALTSVGFSSPPSWVKPYHVLSNGERFRCDLARGILNGGELVVFDEFTSVVDRTVAKIGSAAVSKAIRKGNLGRRFVAVTCHYDVVEWLEPDWVLDMASRRLARGRLRRPEIRLEIAPVHHSAWSLFRRHHYLSGNLSTTARCFVAFFGDEPVAFSAWIHRMTRIRRKGDMREHRTVVLPDYQGVGIGNRLSEFCASIWKGLGGAAYSTTGHPAMIRYRLKSPLWRKVRLGMVSPSGKTGVYGQAQQNQKGHTRDLASSTSVGRLTGGFEYIGPAMETEDAHRIADTRTAPWIKGRSLVSIETGIRKYPGASVSLLNRLTGLSSSVIRAELKTMAERGEVIRMGVGGGGGRRFAFYPGKCTGIDQGLARGDPGRCCASPLPARSSVVDRQR